METHFDFARVGRLVAQRKPGSRDRQQLLLPPGRENIIPCFASIRRRCLLYHMDVVQNYPTCGAPSGRNDDGQHHQGDRNNSVGSGAAKTATTTGVASSLSQRIELLDSETRCTTQPKVFGGLFIVCSEHSSCGRH